MSNVYRLSWEMPADNYRIAEIEAQYGPAIWSTFRDWDDMALEWKPVSVDFSNLEDRLDQYRTLKAWAESHEQPIRNVQLQKAVVSDPVWESIDA